MNGFDISGLSPEELQQLTIHAIQSNEECVEAIKKLYEGMKMMSDKIGQMDEEVDKIGKVVMEEIIGGVEELYNKNQHDMSLEDLKGKYGDLFEPHLGAFSEMYPDVDLYEELLKEKEGFGDDEEAFGGRVNELGGLLKAKMDRIRGVPSEVQAKPEMPGEVERDAGAMPEEGAAPAEEPEVDVVETIKKMKTRKNPLSMD